MNRELIFATVYSGLYIALILIVLILAAVSFHEEVPPYARDPPILMPVHRMAVFLYRKIHEYRGRRKKIGKDLFIPGEEGVRRNLSILYPSMEARRQEIRYRLLQIERVLLVLLAGVIAAAALHFSALYSGVMQEDGSVRRSATGGGDLRISVRAYSREEDDGEKANSGQEDAERGRTEEGLSETALEKTEEEDEAEEAGTDHIPAETDKDRQGKTQEKTQEKRNEKRNEKSNEKRKEKNETEYGTYSLTIHARKFTRQEAAVHAQEILDRFPRSILGDNESPDNIRKPLSMQSADPTDPFVLNWESSRYAVMDTDGSVFNSEYAEDQEEKVVLTAVLTYADYRFEKKMNFTVRAPVRDEQEKLREGISRALEDAEKESATEDSFHFPAAAQGILLSWKEQVEDTSAGVLAMAAAACFAAWYMMDSRLREKTLSRSRQLAVDYPRLISRIVLYLGAGMSVRNIFFKCASEYSGSRSGNGEQGKKSEKESGGRYLQEEILLVCNELNSGIPETEAYMHFGRRCRSRQYTKLCSLLVQNLRRGNDTLLEILQEEAENSFEERKNLARELGEEAGTKLLLPMMIMLGITMLIIIVPAYFGFSM